MRRNPRQLFTLESSVCLTIKHTGKSFWIFLDEILISKFKLRRFLLKSAGGLTKLLEKVERENVKTQFRLEMKPRRIICRQLVNVRRRYWIKSKKLEFRFPRKIVPEIVVENQRSRVAVFLNCSLSCTRLVMTDGMQYGGRNTAHIMQIKQVNDMIKNLLVSALNHHRSTGASVFHGKFDHELFLKWKFIGQDCPERKIDKCIFTSHA